jgi:predicted RNase H-like nuclease (RuvC/YqgF family)
MENEKMMAVLTELLEDQRQIASTQAETMRIVQQLKIKLEQIEAEVKSPKSDPASVNVKEIQHTLEKGIIDIKFQVDMLTQKLPTNNMRVFLESDAKKWAVILLVAITFLTYLYLFGIHK